MKVNRHGKPSKAYLSTLRAPTRADWESLVRAAVSAIISGEKDVLVAFAYVFKFPKGFPKGILVEKRGADNIHRVKAVKLLKWLKDHGHTEITTETLRVQQIAFGLGLGWIDNILDGYEETTT